MSFHFNPYSIALLMSGVAALLMSLVIFARAIDMVRWFAGMMFCSAIWAVCYSLELSSNTLKQMLFWIDLEYIGISFIPATWIIFVIQFIGKNEWLTLRNRILIFSFPVLALFFVWTNSWHHIHYEEVSLDSSGPFPLLAIVPGPWYHVHTVYFYFLLAWGMYLLIRKFHKADNVYKKQNASILLGALIPWTVNVIYLLGWRPYKHLDLTPYAFILTSIVIGFGLLRFKLFDVLPMAREKVIEVIREGILVLDAQGRVIDQNSPMQTFLRFYSNPIVGTPLDQILPKEYKLHQLIAKRANQKLDITLKDETGPKDGLVRRDRSFEVAITPLFEKEMTFSGTLLIFWEITERKRTAEKLKEQAEELTKLNHVKDRMFSIISHDIRGPMASLKGILAIAEEGTLSLAELKAFLPTMSTSVAQTYDLLDNLLQWSRTQLRGETISPEQFDLKPVMMDKRVMFEKRAREKNIQLLDSVAEGTQVWADKNMVRLVLRNLIANSIKFCNPGDTITMEAAVGSATTTVSVTDTGVGMDPETLSQLFGLATLSKPGTNGEKGTGLGLKLCKDFIEMNGGELWAESTPGAGSRFSFSLRNR